MKKHQKSLKKTIYVTFLKSLDKSVNTVYLPTISYLDIDLTKTEVASTPPRIFRRGTISYKNVVHNQAVYKPKVVHANFPILHYGYIWTRSLRKKKNMKELEILLENIYKQLKSH